MTLHRVNAARQLLAVAVWRRLTHSRPWYVESTRVVFLPGDRTLRVVAAFVWWLRWLAPVLRWALRREVEGVARAFRLSCPVDVCETLPEAHQEPLPEREQDRTDRAVELVEATTRALLERVYLRARLHGTSLRIGELSPGEQEQLLEPFRDVLREDLAQFGLCAAQWREIGASEVSREPTGPGILDPFDSEELER